MAEAREECGVVGILSENQVAFELYDGLRMIQHRGQDSCGIVTYDGSIPHAKKGAGKVYEVFDKESLEDLSGNIGLGHVRYATFGKKDQKAMKHDAQPEFVVTPFISVAFNGNIINAPQTLGETKRRPRTGCDVQCLLLPFADKLKKSKEITEDSITSAAEHISRNVKGSYSAVYMTESEDGFTLFAITDPYKVRPLVVGKNKDGWCFASETNVLERLGYEEKIENLDPGSLYIANLTQGLQKKKLIVADKAHCMFEWVYFSGPDSEIEGMPTHDVRFKLGAALARQYPVEADWIIPVPESGRRGGVGYSYQSKIPLNEGLMKTRADERSFILPSTHERERVARETRPIKSVINGNRIVLVDDSIVRGTTLRKHVTKLREVGAREVHLRITCPPIEGPCYFGIDMTSKEEFIAMDENGKSRPWEEINKELGADSLAYTTVDMLKEIINRPLCTGCLDFPNGYPKDVQMDVLKLYNLQTSDKRPYEIGVGSIKA